MPLKYVIVTPARDEERHIQSLISSVVQQSVKPMAWVIVDDGSTDRTTEIATRCARDYPWIKLVYHSVTGKRAPGSKIVEAFKYGEKLVPCNYDFIVKLDADVTMGNDYFEKLLGKFINDSTLGIAGGYCGVRFGGRTVLEESPSYHVRGATKMYRRECYTQIGGLDSVMGWDTLDEMKAMMLGWKTTSFKDAVLIHPRPTGTASGVLRYARMWGESMWFMGYDPLYALLSCLKRVSRKPLGIFGLSMILGYLKSILRRDAVIDDKELVRFIKTFQRKRLLGNAPEALSPRHKLH